MLGVLWMNVTHLGNHIALSHYFLNLRVEVTTSDARAKSFGPSSSKAATMN
jgi:hypothetical protein